MYCIYDIEMNCVFMGYVYFNVIPNGWDINT